MTTEEIENSEHPDLALQLELYNSLEWTMHYLRIQFEACQSDELAWRNYTSDNHKLRHALKLLDAYKMLALRPKQGK